MQNQLTFTKPKPWRGQFGPALAGTTDRALSSTLSVLKLKARLARRREGFLVPAGLALAAAWLALAPGAWAQAPVISSFRAAPANINPGQTSTLNWSVSGATWLSIDQGVGAVTGTNLTVSPAATTLYTLTATNASGSSKDSATVTVSPYTYLIAYDGVLEGSWVVSADYTYNTNPAPSHIIVSGPAPGRTSQAMEIYLGQAGGPSAFGLANVKNPGNGTEYQWMYLNEYQTLEFDIYFEPDSTGVADLQFEVGLDGGNTTDPVALTGLIPGWFFMPNGQRYGQWHHVTADLAGLDPAGVRFWAFAISGPSLSLSHFLVADVKLGWLEDPTPPVFTGVSASLDSTNDQLTLTFTNNDYTIYRVEYGVSNYSYFVQGDFSDWETTHTAVLTELTPGATNQYRILAEAHRNDPTADPVAGIYTNSIVVPPSTNPPPPSPVVVPPANYLIAYDGQLEGSWVGDYWAAFNYEPTTDPGHSINFYATEPGLTNNVIDVRLGQLTGPYAFGLANFEQGDKQWLFFNEFQTLDFDIYFEPDSSAVEDLTFILGDNGSSAEPPLVDLIPGWFVMPYNQRYGQWHHVTVDLASLHSTGFAFYRFDVYEGTGSFYHFLLANVKLGWTHGTTPPTISSVSTSLSQNYKQLTLAFTTDVATTFEVEYGISGYDLTFDGSSTNWQTSQTAVLTNLTPGTYEYFIAVQDHVTDPTDPNDNPNYGFYTNTFVVPPAPVTPPVISGFAATNVLGSSATLVWSTDRPCTAQLTCQHAGGAELTQTFAGLASGGACVLGLLEPNTAYAATLTVTDPFQLSSTQALTFTTTSTYPSPTVTITANPAGTNAISPLIYGINAYEGITNAPANLTLNRAGGDSWTAYNWENNASNSGSDWYDENDAYVGGGDIPAEAVRMRIAGDRARGNASLVTLQLQGYVAADEDSTNAIYPISQIGTKDLATRFKQVIYQKGAAFTASPDTNSPYVYMDEFLWALRGKFAGDIYADATLPTFVSLDNEPDLWSSTHAEIQAAPIPAEDFIQKTIALSKVLKNLDPAVKLFGPVNWGVLGMYDFQLEPGFNSDYWFTDKYLTELKAASDTAGQRLIDVYDFHYYSAVANSQTADIQHLTETDLSPDQVQLIVQSPRSLWDTNYVENSWVVDDIFSGAPICILGRLQAKIDADWPGTKIAITEYNSGGNNHIAGAIAQADYLGIFGSHGLFAATDYPQYPNPDGTYPFIMAAFNMYRNFDGHLGSFGDLSIPATSSDTSKVAAYLSQDSTQPGRYVIVALNRSTSSQDVGFNGLAVSGMASVYLLAGTSPSPVFVGQVPADLSTWVVTLPPLSVVTIELASQASPNTYAAWRAANFSATDQQNDAVSGPGADPDNAGLANVLRYAFALPARGPVTSPTAPLVVPSGGQNVLAVSFNRLASASDITYIIEASFTLAGWAPLAVINPGQPVQVTVPDTVAVASAQSRFLRLSVQYTP